MGQSLLQERRNRDQHEQACWALPGCSAVTHATNTAQHSSSLARCMSSAIEPQKCWILLGS